jgi:hypothetical protein
MSQPPEAPMRTVEIPFVDQDVPGENAPEQKYKIRLAPQPALVVPQLDEVVNRLADLQERVGRIEGSGGMDLSPVVGLLGRRADAVAPQPDSDQRPRLDAEHKRGKRRTRTGRRERAGEGTPGQLAVLPEEVSTAEAAGILGVSVDTVLAYRAKGLLPSRNLAPPGRTKPLYAFLLADVMKLRTSYELEAPDDTRRPEPPRRRVKGRRKFKHLDLGN